MIGPRLLGKVLWQNGDSKPKPTNTATTTSTLFLQHSNYPDFRFLGNLAFWLMLVQLIYLFNSQRLQLKLTVPTPGTAGLAEGMVCALCTGWPQINSLFPHLSKQIYGFCSICLYVKVIPKVWGPGMDSVTTRRISQFSHRLQVLPLSLCLVLFNNRIRNQKIRSPWI